MSAISLNIINTPCKLLTYKMCPVFNGLPFLIYGNRNQRYNFKYIADVYVANVKITTLHHNIDKANALNYGVFDVGRVVENYISTRTNFRLNNASNSLIGTGFINNPISYQQYNLNFGAEYERFFEFYKASNDGGNTRLYLGKSASAPFSQSDLRVGDSILISNASDASYNGTWIVTVSSSSTIRINKPFTATANGTLREGERFSDNYYYFDTSLQKAFVAFTVPNAFPTRINVGDSIVIVQDSIPTNIGYDGEWLCTKIFTSGLNQIIVTNCFYGSAAPINSGSIFSLNKYLWKNLVNSTNEYTWDAGLQYREMNSWNPSLYAMNLTDKGKFLTASPRTIKIGINETATLSHFASSIMGSQTIKSVMAKAYTSSNAFVSSASTNISVTDASYARVEVMTGTKNLGLSINFSNTAIDYYTIELQNVTGGTVSETFTYKLDRSCERYTPYRFKFKNRLGGWDYFTATLRSDRTLHIDRANFRKVQKSVTSVGTGVNGLNAYKTLIGQRGNTTFNVNAYDSEFVRTNWLTNAEALWLEELISTQDGYLLVDNDELPITFNSTDIIIGEKENRGLISYVIDFTYAFNKVIQRG